LKKITTKSKKLQKIIRNFWGSRSLETQITPIEHIKEAPTRNNRAQQGNTNKY
jgi:hypothetical protein